jgi:ABC-type iron transport system FetAB permease component
VFVRIPHDCAMWPAFRFSIVSWVMAAGLVLAPIGVSAWLQLRLHKQLAMALARYRSVVLVAGVTKVQHRWTAGDIQAGHKQLLLNASCRFSARLLLTGLLLLPIMAYEHAVLTALYVVAAIAIGAAEAASHCQYLYQVCRLALGVVVS